MRSSQYEKSIAITFVFFFLGSVLNYFFQFLLGRLLSVEDFGIYNSVNSLICNAVIVYSPLMIILCKLVAERRFDVVFCKTISRQLFFCGIILSLFIFFLGHLFFPAFLGRFGVETRFYWTIVLLSVGCSGIYSICNGMLQGRGAFFQYGLFSVALVFIKILLVFIFIRLNLSMMGIVLSLLLSFLFVSLGIMYSERRNLRSASVDASMNIPKSQLVKLYGITFLIQVLYSFYINGGDTILLSFICSKRDVGLYSLAAIFSKIGMYCVSIISVDLLPTVANQNGNGKECIFILKKTLLITVIFSLLYSCFLILFGEYFIKFFFGLSYSDSTFLLGPVSVFSGLLSILSVFHNYFIGSGRVYGYFFTLLIVSVVSISIILICARTLYYIPIVLSCGLFFQIMISIYIAFFRGKNER